jgi:hypothetical protein
MNRPECETIIVEIPNEVLTALEDMTINVAQLGKVMNDVSLLFWTAENLGSPMVSEELTVH